MGSRISVVSPDLFGKFDDEKVGGCGRVGDTSFTFSSQGCLRSYLGVSLFLGFNTIIFLIISLASDDT
jgi:hypothetical protein